MNTKMAELVMRCFHARTAAHVLHLGSHSYSQHKALETFYEDIIDLVDTLAEVTQGCELELLKLTGPYKPYSDAETLLLELGDWISDNRHECCDAEDTYLQNIIDEIMALIRQTQYKLRFLK